MDFNQVYTQSKELSCGFIVIDTNTNKILAAHPTGKPRNLYDIPKGHLEHGETDLECALRELREETSIVISESDDIKDMGKFPYLPYKDLHIYMVHTPVELESLACSTTFTDKKTNVEKPEMDAYDLVTNINCFYPKLQPILSQCLK